MTAKSEFKVSMEDRKQTYVIIPAYNEETRVRPVIEAIADMGFKIILVNDGSSDGTLDVLKDVQMKYPENIFIYSHVINRGVGLAMQTGFEAVLKYNPKYIVNIDADDDKHQCHKQFVNFLILNLLVDLTANRTAQKTADDH